MTYIKYDMNGKISAIVENNKNYNPFITNAYELTEKLEYKEEIKKLKDNNKINLIYIQKNFIYDNLKKELNLKEGVELPTLDSQDIDLESISDYDFLTQEQMKIK
jgi:hypothetical protein